MPAGEPNFDAPETYWAGQYDAQVLADSIGMSWTAPLWALSEPRIIVVADLCAAPAPSAPEFTTTDLVQGFKIWEDTSALRTKLNNFVDAGLWRNFCTAVDDPEPDPIPPQPPPPDLPSNPAPVPDDKKQHEEVHQWVKWLTKQILPRFFIQGDMQTVSGTGHIEFTADGAGEWTVYAVGAEITVTEKPDYAGRSNGGDFPVYYDLGWISLDSVGAGQNPVRVHHTHQIETGSVPRVDGLYYNLPPGVTLQVIPLFPETPFGTSGG